MALGRVDFDAVHKRLMVLFALAYNEQHLPATTIGSNKERGMLTIAQNSDALGAHVLDGLWRRCQADDDSESEDVLQVARSGVTESRIAPYYARFRIGATGGFDITQAGEPHQGEDGGGAEEVSDDDELPKEDVASAPVVVKAAGGGAVSGGRGKSMSYFVGLDDVVTYEQPYLTSSSSNDAPSQQPPPLSQKKSFADLANLVPPAGYTFEADPENPLADMAESLLTASNAVIFDDRSGAGGWWSFCGECILAAVRLYQPTGGIIKLFAIAVPAVTGVTSQTKLYDLTVALGDGPDGPTLQDDHLHDPTKSPFNNDATLQFDPKSDSYSLLGVQEIDFLLPSDLDPECPGAGESMQSLIARKTRQLTALLFTWSEAHRASLRREGATNITVLIHCVKDTTSAESIASSASLYTLVGLFDESRSFTLHPPRSHATPVNGGGGNSLPGSAHGAGGGGGFSLWLQDFNAAGEHHSQRSVSAAQAATDLLSEYVRFAARGVFRKDGGNVELHRHGTLRQLVRAHTITKLLKGPLEDPQGCCAWVCNLNRGACAPNPSASRIRRWDKQDPSLKLTTNSQPKSSAQWRVPPTSALFSAYALPPGVLRFLAKQMESLWMVNKFRTKTQRAAPAASPRSFGLSPSPRLPPMPRAPRPSQRPNAARRIVVLRSKLEGDEKRGRAALLLNEKTNRARIQKLWMTFKLREYALKRKQLREKQKVQIHHQKQEVQRERIRRVQLAKRRGFTPPSKGRFGGDPRDRSNVGREPRRAITPTGAYTKRVTRAKAPPPAVPRMTLKERFEADQAAKKQQQAAARSAPPVAKPAAVAAVAPPRRAAKPAPPATSSPHSTSPRQPTRNQLFDAAAPVMLPAEILGASTQSAESDAHYAPRGTAPARPTMGGGTGSKPPNAPPRPRPQQPTTSSKHPNGSTNDHAEAMKRVRRELVDLEASRRVLIDQNWSHGARKVIFDSFEDPEYREYFCYLLSGTPQASHIPTPPRATPPPLTLQTHGSRRGSTMKERKSSLPVPSPKNLKGSVLSNCFPSSSSSSSSSAKSSRRSSPISSRSNTPRSRSVSPTNSAHSDEARPYEPEEVHDVPNRGSKQQPSHLVTASSSFKEEVVEEDKRGGGAHRPQAPPEEEEELYKPSPRGPSTSQRTLLSREGSRAGLGGSATTVEYTRVGNTPRSSGTAQSIVVTRFATSGLEVVGGPTKPPLAPASSNSLSSQHQQQQHPSRPRQESVVEEIPYEEDEEESTKAPPVHKPSQGGRHPPAVEQQEDYPSDHEAEDDNDETMDVEAPNGGRRQSQTMRRDSNNSSSGSATKEPPTASMTSRSNSMVAARQPSPPEYTGSVTASPRTTQQQQQQMQKQGSSNTLLNHSLLSNIHDQAKERSLTGQDSTRRRSLHEGSSRIGEEKEESSSTHNKTFVPVQIQQLQEAEDRDEDPQQTATTTTTTTTTATTTLPRRGSSVSILETHLPLQQQEASSSSQRRASNASQKGKLESSSNSVGGGGGVGGGAADVSMSFSSLSMTDVLGPSSYSAPAAAAAAAPSTSKAIPVPPPVAASSTAAPRGVGVGGGSSTPLSDEDGELTYSDED